MTDQEKIDALTAKLREERRRNKILQDDLAHFKRFYYRVTSGVSMAGLREVLAAMDEAKP